jgi:hypothetical protein
MYRPWFVKVALGLLVWQASPSFTWAQRIGSSLDPRGITDTAAGVVFIYEGDFFAPNTEFVYYSFNNSKDPGPAGRFMTPILLQQLATGPNPGDDALMVVGIGESQTILYPGPYTFGFNVQSGSDLITDTGFCFAFINALVDVNGVVTATSTGVVDFDEFQDPDPGISGQGTNEWRFVWPNLPNAIPVGTIFGQGTVYPLNNRSGGFLSDRTYSMYAVSR